ncbi:hypothetical protein [Pseudoxanthomonas japonensis]|uniref:hypothetical protein n=1 Tax=Pseudoxanthomonas japonensis TaxID=69284 RepID=UPI003749B569
MTPHELKMMARHLPPSIRRSIGIRDLAPDPGLTLFQRWPRAGHLRRLIHTVHEVRWARQRSGLIFTVHLAGGRQCELPERPQLPTQDWTGDIEWPASFKAKARELRTTPANLHTAIGMLQDLARWNPRNDRITFPR